MSSNDNLDGVAAPEDGEPEDANRARRIGGARSPVSESVVFQEGDRVIEGWSLNISRGGLRVILDEVVTVGDEFEITLGSDQEPRRGRIVWVRDEKGGAIVGVSFLDAEGSVPPPPDTPPDTPPEELAEAVAAASTEAANGSESTEKAQEPADE